MGVTAFGPEDQVGGGGGSTGGLTDAELRASPVPISIAQLIAAIFATGSAATLGDTGIPALVKRRDSDTSVVTDGQYMTLNCDEEGRVKVASKPASYAATTGNVISATSTIPMNTERFSNLMVHCTGTFAGANCTFEGSLNSTTGTDGNWFTVQAIRSNANTIETATGVLAAAPAYAWELSVNALKWFRIRATAWTSGTQVWTLVPGTYATEPIPGAQTSATQPISGTVTSNEGTPVTPTANILNSLASTNGTVVKGTAGNIYGAVLCNNGVSAAYFKLHNSATVTVGTTAVSMWIKIDAGTTVSIQWGAKGLRHTAGICYSITGAVADTDTTAVAAGQVKVNLSYI